METLDNIMRSLDFEYFATSQHKTSPADFLSNKNGVFLDLRAKEEIETISINLNYHMPVLHIPLNELPDRLSDIPKDKIIGLFCASGVRIAIAYLYLKTSGYENITMLTGGFEALIPELKPGKVLKAMKAQK